MGAIIVVDALWGDSGKGKISAFLSQREQASLCVRAGIGTNAGHSIYLSEEHVIRTRQLPLGFLHETTAIAIGSGVAVDPNIWQYSERFWNGAGGFRTTEGTTSTRNRELETVSR